VAPLHSLVAELIGDSQKRLRQLVLLQKLSQSGFTIFHLPPLQTVVFFLVVSVFLKKKEEDKRDEEEREEEREYSSGASYSTDMIHDKHHENNVVSFCRRS